MCNILSDLASWATLILFFFYFIGRIITICTVKKLWKDKVIFTDELNNQYGVVDEIDVDNNNVRVTISMFGRETPVELELTQIELIKD